MKKNNKLVAMAGLVLSLVAPASVSAIFDAQLGLGYSNVSYKDNGSTGSLGALSDNSYKGAAINAAAHLNFSIPLVLSIGVGPYLSYAPDMNYSGASASSGVTYSNTQTSIGGELVAKLIVIPVVSPYAKFGFGAENLKSTISSSGVTADLIKFSGTGYRVLFGLEVPVAGPVALFAEGGFTGATYDVSLPVLSYTTGKAKSTGYMLNFGVSVGF